jgi:hypothetical protein
MFPRSLSWSVVVATVLLVQCSLVSSQQSPKDRDSAPTASKITVELLPKLKPEGNVLIQVQFEDGRHGGAVKISGPNGPRPLRDDGIDPDRQPGDGRFSAVVNINAEQLNKEMQRRFDVSRQHGTTPHFTGRDFQGFRPIKLPRPVELIPGVPIDITWFGGFWSLVDPERELMIRDLTVVEDPARTYEPCTGTGTRMGAWTFGRLMTEIANEPATGINPSDFVEQWLQQWQTPQLINGFTTSTYDSQIQSFLDAWPRLPDGRLNLEEAPFRLLAIVNRLDLRGNFAYGSASGAEARLVFGALKCEFVDSPKPSDAREFTVIFEYAAPADSCSSARGWARQWRALSSLVIGSAGYNAALQAITDQFTLRDLRPGRPPNRSAINQVRTNAIEIAGSTGWELRESKTPPDGVFAGWLRQVTVAQTPDWHFQNRAQLASFINDEAPAILDGSHAVPLERPAGTPFRGALAFPGSGRAWNAPGILDLDARHRFSLATCDGCHTREVDNQFLHIRPRRIGRVSSLSDFLTGIDMPKLDPVSGVNHSFHELLDRSDKLEATANMLCLAPIDFPVDEFFFREREPALRH